jgi:acetyl coenzyme A synthetase (ADP forming)-like protein
LRDGTTATIRVAQLADKEAVAGFFSSLSQQSHFQRFFTVSQPNKTLIDTFCSNPNPHLRLSLVVTRWVAGNLNIIALGTYIARDPSTAEVAMAVGDKFHGQGIGTLLLERLALIAVMNGFTHFSAVTMGENRAMLDVFRDSGFLVQTKTNDGYVDIDFSVIPTEASVARAEMRDRVSTALSLRPFFHPQSVAVVGASRNPASIGGRILRALITNRFHGAIYPINPKAASVASLTAYPSVSAVPKALDFAIIAVPTAAVLGVIDDCASRGVRAVLVITAGFAETGAEGRQLQQKLLDKVRGYGMRMIGPNCLGLINADPAVNLNASFSPLFPEPGRIAFSSQSGALGLAVLSFAHERELGLSHFVSVGNKADVSGNDLLIYWEEDQRVETILLYLESFGNPRRFARIAKRVGRRKPIVAVKAGRTAAGSRAAGSHTAALAASDVAVDALFHQTGVIRAETLDEMFDLAAALAYQPLPRGRRVAILTNAGGLGILCADSCEAGNLTVIELSARTKDSLRQFLPPTASVANPVDMIASAGPDEFRKATEILLSAEETDALIVLYIDVALADISAIAQSIASAVATARQNGNREKPVYGCVMGFGAKPKPLSSGGERVPNFGFPEIPARAMSKLLAYADWRNKPDGVLPDFADIQPSIARSLCQKILRERGAAWLSPEEIHALLATFSLPLVDTRLCRSADEAVNQARTIGFPVAVKLASQTILHKTEIGGVQLNLERESDVRKAFAAIEDRLREENKSDQMNGVLVEPMLSEGVEVMVGITQDPLFGPLIGFGLGGIHVEILRDICFRVTPITDLDANEMVRSIRGYPLLQGYRGHPPADVAAIEGSASPCGAACRRGAGNIGARSQSRNDFTARSGLYDRGRKDSRPA